MRTVCLGDDDDNDDDDSYLHHPPLCRAQMVHAMMRKRLLKSLESVAEGEEAREGQR